MRSGGGGGGGGGGGSYIFNKKGQAATPVNCMFQTVNMQSSNRYQLPLNEKLQVACIFSV